MSSYRTTIAYSRTPVAADGRVCGRDGLSLPALMVAMRHGRAGGKIEAKRTMEIRCVHDRIGCGGDRQKEAKDENQLQSKVDANTAVKSAKEAKTEYKVFV
ncbi:hypothetical protein MTO96_018704 [Rhipicephalus appendiculatus]